MKIKIAIAGLAVFLTVGAFLYHGHVQYHKGVNDTLAKNLAAGNEALTDNAKIWNEVRHENAKITDRVAAGRDLGILRPDALR